MSILRKAAQFAVEAHRDQRREHSGDPYVVHVFRVAAMAAEFGLSIEAQAAAMLHDVVEDTDFTYGDLVYEFGADIANMVWGLTNVEGRGEMVPGIDNRAKRKAADRAFLSRQSVEVRTVKFLDCIDNMSDRPDASFIGRLLEEMHALFDALHRHADDVGLPMDVDQRVTDLFWDTYYDLEEQHREREAAKSAS
jgi:hypothetical protein